MASLTAAFPYTNLSQILHVKTFAIWRMMRTSNMASFSFDITREVNGTEIRRVSRPNCITQLHSFIHPYCTFTRIPNAKYKINNATYKNNNAKEMPFQVPIWTDADS
jgi:hypothetical protein